nr:acyl-CoA dehydrogenase family protein [Micromonospora sp. DSM 115978]
SYPKELDMLAAVIDGLDASGQGGSGASGVRCSDGGGSGSDAGGVGDAGAAAQVRNGANLSTVLSVMELCWGDVGLLLSMPRQGLGHAAVASVADDAQLARFGHAWAAMAITEPGCGSDSAAVTTTAVLDGDHYVLNGEKIF